MKVSQADIKALTEAEAIFRRGEYFRMEGDEILSTARVMIHLQDLKGRIAMEMKDQELAAKKAPLVPESITPIDRPEETAEPKKAEKKKQAAKKKQDSVKK